MELVGLKLSQEQQRALLKRNAKEMQNYNDNEEEERRKRACPLYWAMFYPESILPPAAPQRGGVENFVVQQDDAAARRHPVEQKRFLEHLLECCASIALRRHGSLLERDPLIMRVFRQLPAIHGNPKLQLTALFLYMWAEPVIVDYVSAMYDQGSRERQTFHHVVHTMKQAVEAMLMYDLPTIYNVVQKKEQLIEVNLIHAYTGAGGKK
jgi:hypothetical protein